MSSSDMIPLDDKHAREECLHVPSVIDIAIKYHNRDSEESIFCLEMRGCHDEDKKGKRTAKFVGDGP